MRLRTKILTYLPPMKILTRYSSLLIFVLLSQCTAKQQESTNTIILDGIDHASTFHFENGESGKLLVVDEPWPKAKTRKEYLIEKAPNRVICTSTSHLPYFELLGLEERVVGFPNAQYISSGTFINRLNQGKLVDVGTDGSINLELMMSLDPDLVIGFDTGAESISLNKIEELGIPVIYNADFLEKTPLGRAEWIKVIGAIFDKDELADSIFNEIENKYNQLKEAGLSVTERPTILSGTVYGDTWFLPGGQNWASIFFENAGGNYLWRSDSTSGWLELSFESVYEKAYKAEFWLGVSSFRSLKEMKGQEDRYSNFDSFSKGKVYNFNKRIGPNGGLDFFESGYARPDIVLADLLKILHPELIPEHETYYFQQLK